MLLTVRLRVRFLMMSLEFFSDIILPVALCPWGRLSLWQKWVPGVFPGSKGGRCIGLTTLPPSCAAVMKSENFNFLEPYGPLQACNGTALPLPFTCRVCSVMYLALHMYSMFCDVFGTAHVQYVLWCIWHCTCTVCSVMYLAVHMYSMFCDVFGSAHVQ